MSTGIVYFLGHPQLASRLVVSLYSLRNWYDGPVTLFTGHASSHGIGETIASDKRLDVQHRRIIEVAADGAYESAYLTKAVLISQSPYSSTIFLDADTIVAGSIKELVDSAENVSLTVTIYGHFITSTKNERSPIRAWQHVFPEDDPRHALVQRVIRYAFPTINTGVFAIQRDSVLAHEWKELALAGRNTPTPDETAMQILTMSYDYKTLGCHFNCMPHWSPYVQNPRIWHFVCASHLRTEVCRRIWLPMYRKCTAENIAELTSWSHVGKPKGKRTTEYWRSRTARPVALANPHPVHFA